MIKWVRKHKLTTALMSAVVVLAGMATYTYAAIHTQYYALKVYPRTSSFSPALLVDVDTGVTYGAKIEQADVSTTACLYIDDERDGTNSNTPAKAAFQIDAYDVSAYALAINQGQCYFEDAVEFDGALQFDGETT